MTLRVGGINIGIGIDGTNLIEGLELAQNQLAVFKRTMTSIRLEAAIKGDPFSATKRYFKEAKKELNSVFTDFSKFVTYNTKDLDKYAERNREIVGKVIKIWENARGKIGNLQSVGETGKLQAGIGLKGEEFKKWFYNEDKEGGLGIVQSLKGFSQMTDNSIKKVTKVINEGGEITNEALRRFLRGLIEDVKAAEPELKTQLLRIGRTLKGAYAASRTLEFKSNLATAGSSENARMGRVKISREQLLAEAELNVQISIGMNVEKNRIALMDLYQKRQQLGLPLTKKQIEYMTQFNATLMEQVRLNKIGMMEAGSAAAKEALIRGGLAFKSDVKGLGSRRGALLSQIEGAKALIKEEARLTGQISIGMNVEKNRIALMDVYQRKQLLGLSLTKKQAEYVRGYRIEQSKLNEVSRSEQMQMQGIRYQAAVGNAGDSVQARLRRAEASKKLTLEEARLNTEMRIGMNTEKNRIALMQNTIQRMELYGKNTKKARAELAKLQAQQQTLSKSGETGFLSPAWFKNRIGWFLQLRGFWALYRGLGTITRSLVEKETQLARAMRTSNSEFMSRNDILEKYSEEMNKAIVKHATDWKTPAEVLYQLTSAGLSSEEALSGLNSTMSLIVGTEGDATEVTKGIAGIYNNFKDSIVGVTSESEKLNYINQLMAVTWKNHQVEIGELIQGYRHSSAMAKVAGTSIEELTALLAMSNDHMIKAGQAGRALTNVFMRIARTPRAFGEAFNIKLDYTKPLKLIEIMEKLSKKMKTGAWSLAQLSDAFERMGIRGAAEFVTLLQNWDEYSGILDEQKDKHAALIIIEKERLDNISSAFKSMGNSLTVTFSKLEKFVGLFHTLKVAAWGWAAAFKAISGEGKPDIAERGRKLVDDLYYLKPNLPKVSKEDMLSLVEYSGALENMMSQIQDSPKGTVRPEVVKETEDQLRKTNELLTLLSKQVVEGLKAQLKAEKEIDRASKDDISRAEKMYEITYKIGSAAEKIVFWREKLIPIEKKISDLLMDVEDAKKKGDYSAGRKIFEDDLVVAQKEKLKVLSLLKNLEKEMQADYKESARYRKSVADNEKDSLDRQVRMLELEKKSNDYKIQGYKIESLTEDEKDKVVILLKEQLRIENEIARKKYIKSRKEVEIGTGEEEAIFRLDLLANQAEFDKRIADAIEARRKSAHKEKTKDLRELIALNSEQVLIAERALINAEIDNATLKERLKLELDILTTRLKGEEAKAELEKDTSAEQQRALNQVRKTMGEIQKQEEKIKEEASIWYAIIKKTEKAVGDISVLYKKLVETMSTGFTTGLSDALYSLVDTSKTKREKIESLQNQITDAKKKLAEYIAAGDTAATATATAELNKLKKELKELKDPITQVENAFKKMFDSVIEGLKKMVADWLAAQIKLQLVKTFWTILSALGGAGSTADTGYGSGNIWTPDLGVAATGGVLPNIKSFKKFSDGGITGGASMAILGDNRSGKELVIPSENIESDKVSGYMRDKSTPVYIANFLTTKDLVAGMASAEGGRVVVNHVIRSRNENGQIWRTT